MTISRQADYLEDYKFLLIGGTTATSTAYSILTALGAEVVRTSTAEGHDLHRYEAVVADRIDLGCDADYGRLVQQSLAQTGASRPGAWITVSAFGLDGPAGGYQGSDLVCAAAGCLLAAVVDEAGQIYPMPAHQALQTVGQAAALAALHGISLSRERGALVHLDVSAQEAIAFCSAQQELAHLMYECGGKGGSARYSAPAGIFECVDGKINIIVIDDHQFARMADAIEQPEWPHDYPDNPARIKNADHINAVVAEWTRRYSKTECERLLQAAGVPATAVRSPLEAAESEQFRARAWDVDASPAARSRGIVPGLIEHRAARGDQTRSPKDSRRVSDMKVVDITHVLAGPLASAILGAMGADVVRVEDKDRLDIYRRNGPFAEGKAGPERAAYFQVANYNKTSVTVGEGEEDAPFMRSLLSWGNVLVENVGARRLARLGITEGGLVGEDGGLVVSVSGFGHTGPAASYRAYAPNVHSFAGLANAIETSTGVEAAIRTSLADYCAAVWAATLAAAWWLGGMHDGETVDLSMAEVIALKLPPGEVTAGSSAKRNSEDLIVKFGSESYGTVSAPGLSDLQTALQVPDRGSAADERVTAAKALASSFGSDAEGLTARLQSSGIPAYIARTPAGLLSDEQVAARGFFVKLNHPELGELRIIALPWKVAGEPRSGYRSAPLLGEGNIRVRNMVAVRKDPSSE